ncbi:hypothetical protein ACFQ2B_35980 [Streptomyces stramineus]|uniref:hypothetical protein n=1 Tax=Streptomyces TaxID=1883 RepID=UPI0031DD9E33
MIVLFAILIVALFGFGFFHPLWWAAAAVLIFVAVHYGRRHEGSRRQDGNVEYRDYRNYRDRENRWDRRYRRQRQGLWSRQNRRDERHHR